MGSLAGEVVGEKVVKETGVDKKVKEAGDQLAGVIGRRQVMSKYLIQVNRFICAPPRAIVIMMMFVMIMIMIIVMITMIMEKVPHGRKGQSQAGP